MKIACLILTHKNPEQLQRIIKAMQHPAIDIYIHVDKKVDIHAFADLENESNVFFIKNRVKVYWGSYSVIQATLNGFAEIIPKSYDYINVMSAQDFPLKPASFIYEYIKKRRGTEFVTCLSVDKQWQEAKIRVTNYFFMNWRFPGRFRLEKIINAVLPKRKFPLNYEIVGKECWFTITTAAAIYIVDFIKKHPEAVRFFKFTWTADELMIPTILYNSQFKDRISDNLVYIDWSESLDAHPKIFKMKDAEKLSQSEKLFARKFDVAVDEEILSYLENSFQCMPIQ
jgi:hypothetical protein